MSRLRLSNSNNIRYQLPTIWGNEFCSNNIIEDKELLVHYRTFIDDYSTFSLIAARGAGYHYCKLYRTWISSFKRLLISLSWTFSWTKLLHEHSLQSPIISVWKWSYHFTLCPFLLGGSGAQILQRARPRFVMKLQHCKILTQFLS